MAITSAKTRQKSEHTLKRTELELAARGIIQELTTHASENEKGAGARGVGRSCCFGCTGCKVLAQWLNSQFLHVVMMTLSNLGYGEGKRGRACAVAQGSYRL